jgi:hypothetical protein
MNETRKISGKIKFIGEPKEFGKLKSVGIKLENDETWHNIAEFSDEAIKSILGETMVRDEVTFEEVNTRGHWNVKKITKGIDVNCIQAPSQTAGKNSPIGTVDDRFSPIGDVYAKVDEYGKAILEQNAFIETQLKNQTDLLMRIAEKLGVDLGFQKASGGQTE